MIYENANCLTKIFLKLTKRHRFGLLSECEVLICSTIHVECQPLLKSTYVVEFTKPKCLFV